MQARKFEHFLKHLALLTPRQRERLLGLLLPQARRDQAVDLIEQATARRLTCPGCGSYNYLGWRWALDGGRVKTPEDLLRAALGIFHT